MHFEAFGETEANKKQFVSAICCFLFSPKSNIWIIKKREQFNNIPY